MYPAGKSLASPPNVVFPRVIFVVCALVQLSTNGWVLCHGCTVSRRCSWCVRATSRTVQLSGRVLTNDRYIHLVHALLRRGIRFVATPRFFLWGGGIFPRFVDVLVCSFLSAICNF